MFNQYYIIYYLFINHLLAFKVPIEDRRVVRVTKRLFPVTIHTELEIFTIFRI